MCGDLAISVQNVSKKFRRGADPNGRLLSWLTRAPGGEEIWALQNVSFEVKRGETIGLVGTNGAGKSTLLRILARVTRPSVGRAEVYGRIAALLEVSTGFHPEFTGRENIYLKGAIYGMSKWDIQRQLGAIVDFAEMHDALDTPIKRYSSGMRARLGFAVATHLDPDILIIDEALTVGDAAFREKCLQKMESLAREGRTVLLVAHHATLITRLCDRALWLQDGRLKGIGNATGIVQTYLDTTMAQEGEAVQMVLPFYDL